MDPAVEAAHQPNCAPLPGWMFTLGTSYKTRAVSGPWGSLSIVTGAYAGAPTTLASTPLLDQAGPSHRAEHRGCDHDRTHAGAGQPGVAPEQPLGAGRHTDRPDPLPAAPGRVRVRGTALRARRPQRRQRRVGRLPQRREARVLLRLLRLTAADERDDRHPQADPGAGRDRRIVLVPGNLSFNGSGMFSLAVPSGQTSAQQTFIRGQVRPGEPPWTVQELVPPNWRLSGLACISADGREPERRPAGRGEATIVLAASDTVTCTYTDEFVPPPGGLLIRKVTYGADRELRLHRDAVRRRRGRERDRRDHARRGGRRRHPQPAEPQRRPVLAQRDITAPATPAAGRSAPSTATARSWR